MLKHFCRGALTAFVIALIGLGFTATAWSTPYSGFFVANLSYHAITIKLTPKECMQTLAADGDLTIPHGADRHLRVATDTSGKCAVLHRPSAFTIEIQAPNGANCTIDVEKWWDKGWNGNANCGHGIRATVYQAHAYTGPGIIAHNTGLQIEVTRTQ